MWSGNDSEWSKLVLFVLLQTTSLEFNTGASDGRWRSCVWSLYIRECESAAFLGWAPTRQHVSPQNGITGLEEIRVQFRKPSSNSSSAAGSSAHTFSSWLLSFWRSEQWPPALCRYISHQYSWQILTLSLQAPVAARLHCSARLVRLGDSSFQPSITCEMRKKSSGSFTSLCAGFVGILCKFFVNIWSFVEIWCVFVFNLYVILKIFGLFWGDFKCICGSFVEVLCLFVEVLSVFVEVLCLFVEVLSVFLEVLSVFLEVLCRFWVYLWKFCMFLWKFCVYLCRFWVYLWKFCMFLWKFCVYLCRFWVFCGTFEWFCGTFVFICVGFECKKHLTCVYTESHNIRTSDRWNE